MKILLCSLVLVSSCLATDSSNILLEKIQALAENDFSVSHLTQNVTALLTGSNSSAEVSTQSFSTNATAKNNETAKQDSTNATHFPAINGRTSLSPESSAPIHADEFKVRVLDLNHPTKPSEVTGSQISIGLPIHHQGPHIVKVPELYIVKVPHYVLVKESDFLSNRHYATPSITGPFYPFQEIPSLNQDFAIGDNLFGISSGYPIYPIQPPQAVEQFPAIGGAEEVPIVPEIGQISEGFQILQPDHVDGLTDERIDHESDSITVDALENLRSTFKEFKAATKRNEAGNSDVIKGSKVDEKQGAKET